VPKRCILSGGAFAEFCFVVDSTQPAAMRDVETAAKAIIEQAEKGNWGTGVDITSNIREAVVAKLRAAYPRRFVIMYPIIEPILSTAWGGPAHTPC
jgi:hypothetical protein